jgi:DNA-binding LytR/AlgR family response regulator
MIVLIIEDNIIWQAKIKELLYLIDPNYIVHVCNLLEDSLQYLESIIPDLIVCDIMLEEEEVFDIFEHIEYRDIPCIFITVSESEVFYKKSKEIHNSAFLVKPFQMLSLKSAIESVMLNHARKLGRSPRGISVKGIHNEKIMLKLTDIVIVESDLNYCILKTRKNKYAIKSTLKKINEDLGTEIIQIHKKYLVNKNYITKINLSRMEIITEIGIFPVGRKYKPLLLDHLNELRIL